MDERRALAGQLVYYSSQCSCGEAFFSPYYCGADTIASTRRARSASGCGRRSLEGSKGPRARRGGTCWAMLGWLNANFLLGTNTFEVLL